MEQAELLRTVVAVLERLDVPYMVVGSFGSIVYGEPRFTNDIVAELPGPLVPEFCAAFPPPQYYLSEAAVRDAVANRFQFNVLHPATGNKVDMILPRTDEWGAHTTEPTAARRTRRRPRSVRRGPEDVIVGKLWYYAEGGSDKHLRDIASMLRVSGAAIDRTTVARWAAQLGYTALWETVVQRVDGPAPGGTDGTA